MSAVSASEGGVVGGRRFMWIAIAMVAVVVVGTTAGLVAAGLSSHSSTSAAVSPPGVAPQPLKGLPGGATAPGFGGRGLGDLRGLGTPVVTGTITKVSASGFSVTSRQGGTVSVTVTSATRFVGLSTTSLSSLKKGQVVAVFGSLSGTSNVSATIVASGAGRGARFGSRRGVFGSISSIGTNEFMVTSLTGATETVKVSTSTSFRDSAGVLKGISALKTGESVLVRGTVSGSVVTAANVIVVPAGVTPGFGGGAGFGAGVGGGLGGTGF